MGTFLCDEHTLIWQENHHRVWLEPWGKNGLRLRANLAQRLLDLPQALLEKPPLSAGEIEIHIEADKAILRNGTLQAEIASNGRIRYLRVPEGQILLTEPEPTYYDPSARRFKPRSGGLYQIEAAFEAQEGERFYGLGQHKHGRLNQKGCILDLQQRNTEIAVPFLISSLGYGFLWNNPAIGRVELGVNGTRWVADGARQMDYYIFCGKSYTELLERYADATGHAPLLPEWALGFWQCKLRYETQEELLNIAREYKRRGLPLSILVIDFFHWTHHGDWKFDPRCWPDPAAMVRELERMGIRVMVSIWPTVIAQSENYALMTERGFLINNERGVDAQHVFIDNDIPGAAYFAYYDATNPAARRFLWETVKKNYYDYGIKLWWLDNDEPDINPWAPENLRFYLGNGLEVANIYPLMHQMAFYEGMRSVGETEIVTLSRSAWAGSQRFGSVIWSGDIASTFESLQAQVRAGLNMAMSGIPWWTTDIGGFHGGDIRSDYFRELIVRWFQYGAFCPIFRLHGYRLPVKGPMPASGADNEIWSFGEQAYSILRAWLMLRERLRPYLHAQMMLASQQGLPPMRPLFVDFTDPVCATIEDEFLCGPEILVAPILHLGERQRAVYLPADANWVNAWNGNVYAGGQWIETLAPLEIIPVFLREESALRSAFQGMVAGP